MGLPAEDHLHDEVPFDDDDSLHQNMSSYHHPDINALENQNSSMLAHPPSTDPRVAYNAKFPPHLQRRLPRAFPQPPGVPHQNTNQEILAHDDHIQSPLTHEQPHPHHDHASMHLEYPTQQIPLNGLSMPGHLNKLALIPHIQPPLLYQFATQIPQPPMHGQPQLMNLTHMPQLYSQMPQYTQPLTQQIAHQGSHQHVQVLPTNAVNSLPPQMLPLSHQQSASPIQGMHEAYVNSSYEAQKGNSEEDIGDSIKRRVAPRRADLFRVGPPFSDTTEHRPIFRADTHERLNPHIEARIDRGFESAANGKWIGYKRNYFTLVVAFDLGIDMDAFTGTKFYTSRNLTVGSEDVPIEYFALNIDVKCSDPDAQVSLVQHTPKRDKGPQNPPPVFPAVPGRLPDHETVKESCNKRNDTKLELMNKIFNFDRNEYCSQRRLSQDDDQSILSTYPQSKIARVARFERIQFTKSIRTKATTMQHKYFKLHAELVGIVGSGLEQQQLVLASVKTPGLLVRGRSPSKYHTKKPSGYRGPSDSENYSM